MESRTIHADSTEIPAATRSIAALFDSLEDGRRIILEMAASDRDCAHIVLGDGTLNRMSDLRYWFATEPRRFSRGSAREIVNNYPELAGAEAGGAADSVEKLGGAADGSRTDPAEYERKRDALNAVAAAYFGTLAELRELIRTDADCAKAVVHNRRWLTYRTAEGDTMANDVVRNRDGSFVRRFVNRDLQNYRSDSAVIRPDEYGWTPLHWAVMNCDIARDMAGLSSEMAKELKLMDIKDDARKSVGDMIKDTMAREDSRRRELARLKAATAEISKTMAERVLCDVLRGLKPER